MVTLNVLLLEIEINLIRVAVFKNEGLESIFNFSR